MTHQGILILTITHDFIRSHGYSHLLTNVHDVSNVHTNALVLSSIGDEIAKNISIMTGKQLTAVPNVKQITNTLHTLRFTVSFTRVAWTQAKIISDNTCEYFAYLLGIHRGQVRYINKRQKNT